MKKLLQQLTLAAGVIFGASANAAIIEVVDVVGPANMFDSNGLQNNLVSGLASGRGYNTVNFTHDLTDNPEFPFEDVISGMISIALYDDQVSYCLPFVGCYNGDDLALEVALIVVAGFDFETGNINFGTGGGFNAGLGTQALTDAEAGSVAVNISPLVGLGATDFYVGLSTLTLQVESNPVPVPTTLALFGLGLLGLGAVRKRKQATA
ncbi:PEP-CTERM sorting domain-containing protein [Parahaliea aestuarii]|uniref:PEP-CTERM sorting domain-containing protein n=1 Tax=Parahaliea aestuarii TaxID=1852021 RepID=A0A5C8ZPU3_9GAMM|nr:PEP-CTERM sorting domain-containing protein [Parahaliea aestuarii]TXS89670.1 PEP-CTERM sorting domain-containing protein [Parahaliea aestuarii]